MHQLKICTFKGIQNLPLYVATQQDFFAQQGLQIEIAYTSGSIPQHEPSLGLDASVAHHVYTVFVDPKSGFGQDPLLDDAGLKQVIDLRAKYASSPLIEELAYYRDFRLYPR